MQTLKFDKILLAAALCLAMACPAFGQASPAEAAKLKTTLTPMGAERAGNKEGTIPAWTGSYRTQDPNYKPGGYRRSDPFANEKPLFSITAKNMDKYADKISDGFKAMLKKYPDFRMDVYPTHRTGGAPQWFYDNTFKNATRAKLVTLPSGPSFTGAYAGVPFPIPHNGTEAMWNHLTSWTGEDYSIDQRQYQGTADGHMVLLTDGTADQSAPYAYHDSSPDKFNGGYYNSLLTVVGPPIRAGMAVTGHFDLDDNNSRAWVYLPGQRRTRMLPNPCCDTPAPNTGGVMTYDEPNVFMGRMDRFNWKLLGKKELYIPYNSNKILQPTSDNVIFSKHFLNPDYVRWELHRVWVVEATLISGRRHQAARSIYYLDEDTWAAAIGDRWDVKGQLWKTDFALKFLVPEIQSVATMSGFGYYDLLSGTWFASGVYNSKPSQIKVHTRHLPANMFTAEYLSTTGVR